jgi:hypothetical protein
VERHKELIILSSPEFAFWCVVDRLKNYGAIAEMD